MRRLALLLRQSNIPVALDQLYLDDHPGGPDEGWPQWCEDRGNKSEAVLIIASAGWFASYERTEAAGVGCGAAAEAALFQQYFYDEKWNNLASVLLFSTRWRRIASQYACALGRATSLSPPVPNSSSWSPGWPSDSS